MHQGLGAGWSCGALTAAWHRGSSQGQAGADEASGGTAL